MNMTDKEREMIPELLAIAQKLPAREQEHLIWIGQGILFASSARDGKEGRGNT